MGKAPETIDRFLRQNQRLFVASDESEGEGYAILSACESIFIAEATVCRHGGFGRNEKTGIIAADHEGKRQPILESCRDLRLGPFIHEFEGQVRPAKRFSKSGRRG